VSINLRDQMIWCYACDSEVIGVFPPTKKEERSLPTLSLVSPLPRADTDYSQEDAAFIDKLRESLTASISTPAPAPAPRAASNAKGDCFPPVQILFALSLSPSLPPRWSCSTVCSPSLMAFASCRVLRPG